ncbi:MAG TPA: SIS domain-containing protein [Actinomycetota bacterium]|nr:SIS domain-containing protein [Actinomycetota bacterium]
MESLGNFPDPFLAEIVSQPQAIRRTAEAAADQRDVLGRVREAAAGRTLVFTGMGSSYDACYPIVSDLAGRGALTLLVDAAELLHFRRPILTAGTIIVIVSQSGESAEIVRLAAEISGQPAHPPVVSITNGLDNGLAGLADLRLDTRAGSETGPSTKTFAGSLTMLAGLARVLDGEDIDVAMDRLGDAAEEAALAAERLLADPVTLATMLARHLGGRDVVVLLGRGPARAATEMGALTMKESGLMAEALESAMFRHGPLELAGPGMSAIVVATEPETRSLDLSLATELVDAGAAVLVISPDGERLDGADALATGSSDRMLGPAVSVVPIQVLAWKLSTASGRTPGSFMRASKVTTRE